MALDNIKATFKAVMPHQYELMASLKAILLKPCEILLKQYTKLIAALDAWWRDQNELLRADHVLRLGPLAVLRTRDLGVLLDFKDFTNTFVPGRHVTNASRPGRSSRQPSGSGRPSVLFLNNSYYNFFYLAAALRRLGWDALSVSFEDPNGPNAQFYHGEDVNLFDRDPERFRCRSSDFFDEVESRFRMVHFYGIGLMSFFPERFDHQRSFHVLPTDFLRLRQRGIKIGYSVCGCADGVAQSSVKAWTGACDRCVWQHQPQVCDDNGNLAWGHKVRLMCDLIATEGFPALDWQGNGDTLFREPLTTALDPDFWRLDLKIPERYRLKRAPGELIVYHSVGNYDLRTRAGRNLKGTGAIVAAIDRLRGEGVPVRLEFVTDVPSKDVRFIQKQADVIVDQLNYGRYGATAREGMMLGRPTICYIEQDEPPGAERLESIETCPLVSATEQSIYNVLKDLLGDEARRRALGATGRAFALKWHSADACAKRFERVHDRLMQGLPPSEPRAAAGAR
jgi:glycosyltransferase involved in cell wall biosynthesis